MDPAHHYPLDRGPEAAQLALERPDSADAVALIAELETELSARYPPESRHGYSVDKLLREGVVRPRFRGLGLGKLMLDRFATHAREQSVGLLRLETGIHQTAAIRLYEACGFRRRPPFGRYMDDPLSLYCEKQI
jgi:GNAT superfamily N-acetyltransferase